MPNHLLYTHRDRGKNAAVVFIHGFMGDAKKTWGDFPKFVMDDRKLDEWDVYSLGYPTSPWFDITGLWSADPDVTRIASLLGTHLEFGTALGRYKAIALIAHSMGGLVVQRALVDATPALLHRVDAVVLFGTPSDGLIKAALAEIWKKSLEDMGAGGRFITSLRAAWKERFASRRDFAFRAVAGASDQFVPAESSLTPFDQADTSTVPGNHLTMVKPESADELPVRIVVNTLTRAPGGADAPERAEFRKTVNELLPIKGDLDQKRLVKLALALEVLGRADEALDVLRGARPDQYDARGTFAGRLKRQWRLVGSEAAGIEARDVYRDTFELARRNGKHADAFYNGINYAFMTFAFEEDAEKARMIAAEVLTECTVAATSPFTQKHWLYATEGEAHLYLGEPEKALEKYRQAKAATSSARDCDSMYQQAQYVTAVLDDQNLTMTKALGEMFGRTNGSPASPAPAPATRA